MNSVAAVEGSVQSYFVSEASDEAWIIHLNDIINLMQRKKKLNMGLL